LSRTIKALHESPQHDGVLPGDRQLLCRRRPRRWHIEVACTRPDGGHYILALDNAMARLVAHEVDHLNGRLYVSRMREGTRPIPVAEYRGTGHAWAYPTQSRAAER
jgi:Polypeptide deformylase